MTEYGPAGASSSRKMTSFLPTHASTCRGPRASSASAVIFPVRPAILIPLWYRDHDGLAVAAIHRVGLDRRRTLSDGDCTTERHTAVKSFALRVGLESRCHGTRDCSLGVAASPATVDIVLALQLIYTAENHS